MGEKRRRFGHEGKPYSYSGINFFLTTISDAGVMVETGSEIDEASVSDKVLLSYAFCNNCKQSKSGRAPYFDSMMQLNFGGLRDDGTSGLAPNDGSPLISLARVPFRDSLLSQALQVHRQGSPGYSSRSLCSFGIVDYRLVLDPVLIHYMYKKEVMLQYSVSDQSD